MIQFENEVTIHQPVSEVFAYIADMTRWPEWRSAVKGIRRTNEIQQGVGATWEVDAEAMGRSMTMAIEVIAFEPDQHIGLRMASGPIQGESHFRFEPVGEATKLHLTTQGETAGVMRLAESMVKGRMEEEWGRDLGRLQARLEA
jgi:uncharacterized protein YndB with AHSA1/START domain